MADHPPKAYYERIGFPSDVAETVVEGFKAPEDYPTHEEWVTAMTERRCPYCDTDASELDAPLDEHVLDCQPISVEA